MTGRERVAGAFRWGVPALGAAQTLFWIYTIHYVFARASPTGDGMEIVALFPMTMIFLIGSLPGLLLGLQRRTAPAGAVFVLGALVANAWIWTEILGEFGPRRG